MKTSVLVVEDDEVLNQLLVMALRKAGYEMSSARFWSDARRQIEMQAPDVVLLDMNLPDAEGLEPLAEIAADRPTVMLTAYGSIDNAVKAMRLGAADYLVKPVNLDELEIVIRRAVDTGRLRAARAMDQAASSVRRTPTLKSPSAGIRFS
jgi:two-component system NtrC family response regulator